MRMAAEPRFRTLRPLGSSKVVRFKIRHLISRVDLGVYAGAYLGFRILKVSIDKAI